ncbi:phage antirepressor KilAC domain-containing protein [Companilactobacillus sp.]|jgi:Rha family phage regulatory protein|uniref:phage antirepressor KilAC domain-containing protein n=2 Tax=Companilactobacillus sp. TaxID=2767905 RepID=UPI0025C3DDA4|nr:phage antirepressor KilAC domain-containing protein [Companilactobacillus sp.]MCH4008111.1 phage antirepressor KilAC domain-containing protein [Companilactobacillus sp.]MCH4051710.1 phage antirepressor KilAC domain-containing protein [Companilactobacillus sp.]MCH4076054.1 phage antirepressor KilAC domain-containing protein [Companilactobacillus sp.]MCH4124629.1 phage antirepressor KilAC domain-containing protein [Companilactobacillus sp.]MCH4132408.1 phage antirepressor KilAC domain-contain
MNNLVIMKDQQAVTSSLQVAETFDKSHKHVLEAIDNLKEGVAENWADLFYEDTYIHPQNRQPYRVIYMNRDGFTLLAMGFTGKKALKFKMQYIEAFNKMEDQIKTGGFKIPSTMAEALRLAADQQEQLELMKPKAVFADSVATSHTTILVGDLAKIIKGNGVDTGARRLFQWMRDNGYLIKRKGTDYNSPTQKSMEMGLFKIKESSHVNGDGVTVVTKTPKVTGKGQQYFVNKFLADQQLKIL